MNAPISWIAPAGDAVCICGIGARTPLGFDAPASAAAVRGGISAVAAHPDFVDQQGEPMSLAVDAGFEASLPISSRIEQLLMSALMQATAPMLAVQLSAPVQCWIGIPEMRAGLPTDLAGAVVNVAQGALSAGSSVYALQRGHAAGLMAMQVAAQKIAMGEAQFCVAAGVDSYHDIATLESLDRTGFLMSPENRNGFPPGEGAGACLLTRESIATSRGLPIMARIEAATTAFESKSIGTPEVCIGEGLTAALQGVISSLRLPQQVITATYCDLNGVRYRNEEFVYTMLRVQGAFRDAHDYLSPADCWGDVGAASGPLFASLAIASQQRGYARGPTPLLWAGSDSGYRSAMLLTLAEQ